MSPMTMLTNYFLKYLLGIVFFLTLNHNVFACELIDDEGNVIKLIRPAERIVSLAPDLTEILFAADAGDKLVGVVQGSDYPVAAKKIPIVATYNSIDLEKVLALHSDLIIAWTETSYLSQLKKLGIPIYLSHQKKLTDIANTLKKFGCLAGTEKYADAAADAFLERYQALQKKYRHSKPLTVFYQVWPIPLITITKNSWINEVISVCGGQNIFADLKGIAPEVSLEAVIAANPDVIIGTRSVQNSLASEPLQQWQHWSQLAAVQSKRLFTIDPDLIERASPRVLDGVERICGFLSA
jgi:iron complex transport system substrate-binding protein